MNEQDSAVHAALKKELLDYVMPFWTQRCIDKEYGGYLTGFDRIGHILDDSKNIWMQGRMVWMFSQLAEAFPKQKDYWLAYAKIGKDFLLDYAYAGNGRWHYILSRNGDVLKGPISIYADLFALEGLSKYMLVSGDEEGRQYLLDTLDALRTEYMCGKKSRIAPQIFLPGIDKHGVFMIALNSLGSVQALFPTADVQSFRAHLLQYILTTFVNTKQNLLFEEYALPHQSATASTLINPGHTFES